MGLLEIIGYAIGSSIAHEGNILDRVLWPRNFTLAMTLWSRLTARFNPSDIHERVELGREAVRICEELGRYDMAVEAAKEVYEKASLGPKDIDVVELHDCFTANEILTYEALGLCGEGEAEKLIWDGENTYGGTWVTNPSGGLLSKGHPLGATGLAQCAELVWQLRGQAEKRQVDGAKIALQHNLGLGGAAVVTMYKKADIR